MVGGYLVDTEMREVRTVVCCWVTSPRSFVFYEDGRVMERWMRSSDGRVNQTGTEV